MSKIFNHYPQKKNQRWRAAPFPLKFYFLLLWKIYNLRTTHFSWRTCACASQVALSLCWQCREAHWDLWMWSRGTLMWSRPWSPTQWLWPLTWPKVCSSGPTTRATFTRVTDSRAPPFTAVSCSILDQTEIYYYPQVLFNWSSDGFFPACLSLLNRWIRHHRSGLRLAHWQPVLGQSEDKVH